MAVDESFREDVLHRLRGLGSIVDKCMFGGVGLWSEGAMFGLLDDDRFFLAVGDDLRERYEAEGAEPFMPGGKRLSGWYRVIEAVLADRTELPRRVRAAMATAAAKQAKKKARADESRPRSLSAARNLGPASARWLRAAGITTLDELRERGSVAAFLAVRDAGFAPSANLLYALEGALLDRRWNELPDALRIDLRRRAGLPVPKRR